MLCVMDYHGTIFLIFREVTCIMRKRGLTYLLAAMMLIGSTGISSSYVRADEPAVTEEASRDETETVETEDATEEDTAEMITEEVSEESETAEEVTEDISETVESPVEGENESDDSELENAYLIDMSDVDASEEDMAPTDWLKDYDYEMYASNQRRYLKLTNYKGEGGDIYLPRTVKINGRRYYVQLDVLRGENGKRYASIFCGSTITNLSFEKGFEFPEDSSYLFANTRFWNIDFTGVDTSKVTNMTGMFYESDGHGELDLSSFDTSNVTTMRGMFSCNWSVEKVDVSSFDTSNVTDMANMFAATHLKSVDVSNFDTSKVTDMSDMFYGNMITSLDLSNFNTSKVKNFSGMLHGVSRINISSFDFSSAESLDDFWGSSMNQYAPSEIITPKNLKKDIILPQAYNWSEGDYFKYFDENGKVYTKLPKNSSKSIKLIKDMEFLDGWVDDGRSGLRYYDKNKLYNGPIRLVRRDKNKDDVWWVVNSEGKHDETVTGIVHKITNGHLRFARNGVMDLTFTGLALDPQNHWRFVRNGIIDSSFTGIAKNTNGRWYYCKKGRIDTSFTNMIAKNTNGKYHYVLNGRPTSKFNGIAYCPEAKNWYYCEKGVVTFKFSGKVAPCTNGSWYYVTKSRIDRSFTGIAPGTDGKKYYVLKGFVDRTFTGPYTYNKITYNVVNGVVKN